MQQEADGDGKRESHLVMMGESGTIELQCNEMHDVLLAGKKWNLEKSGTCWELHTKWNVTMLSPLLEASSLLKY
eukprot:scaffold877_cov100-Skeletonema_dohrnii-CCMP3373.AAC.3